MRKKAIKIGLLILLLIISIIVLSVFFLFHMSLPQTKGVIAVDGLTGEVEVFRDKVGIPHIFAKNERDLFFACGYIHAQDRLWQMELARRFGAGTLSEIFGERALKQDIQMRVLGLKKAAEKDLELLSPEKREWLSAYCEGVNFFLKTKKILSPEFLILRYRPQPWAIVDSLVIKEIMALGLSVNMSSELLRMELTKRIGAEKTKEIIHSYPPDGPTILTSSDFSVLKSNVLPKNLGSNNWVVDGSLTQTGKPLLANDPHLEVNQIPPVWYQIHLNCPGINVIGVSFPGIPVIILGHNEYIAWGMTNSFADVQDLYLEKIDSAQKKYFFNGEWRDLKINREEFKIKGKKEPKIVDVIWTHRGPIITPWIAKSERPISLRWTIHDGGHAAEALNSMNKAKNWEDFKRALSLFDAPSQNIVYADVEGNIGYYLNGKIPIRRNQQGLIPASGETDEYDWKGYLPEEEKPVSLNPPEHFIVTANNKTVPDDYPYFLGDDYIAPFRAARIKELLLKRKNHSVKSFEEIQLDTVSHRALFFLPFIREAKHLEGEANKAQEILNNWDGKIAEGKESALFEVFLETLHGSTFEDELGASYPLFRDETSNNWAGLLRIMDNPQSPWFDDVRTPVKENREDMIQKSLGQAYKLLTKKYGTPENWDWTKMHTIYFQHVLSQVPIFKFLSRGPYPIKGDSDTVNASLFDASNPYPTTVGVSFRQIVDLNNFRNSVFIIPCGQAGHFQSRHYDDQIRPWLEGRYYSMLFSREDIVQNTEGKLILKPAK
jgi:penicillin amidase